MGYTDNAKNSMLESLVSRATHLSLHTAEPSDSGSNEVEGSGYARVAVTASDFATAANGSTQLNNDKNFSGPAAGACTYFGVWDGTNFLGSGLNAGDTQFNAEGAVILKTGTSMNLNG